MKKVIAIPEPVQVPIQKIVGGEVLDTEKEVSFVKFLELACNNYQKFAKGPAMARQYGQIMDAIDAVNGDKKLSFGESDFEVVKGAVESANWATAKVNRAYLPFYEAVEKAETVKEPDKKA